MNAQELRELNKNRKITQLCFATDDYQKMIRYLTEHFQWGPWHIGIDSNQTADVLLVDGKQVKDWSFYFAVTTIGDLEIEVVQPINGPAHFDKFLREKGPGLHHFKESINDTEAMLARSKEFEALGCRNFYQCSYRDETYLFLDSYQDLGTYYEMSNNVEGNGDLSEMPGFVGQYPEE